MRLAMSVLALALCACEGEQDFDERYSRSQDEIEKRAKDIDNSVNDPGPKVSVDDEPEPQKD